MKKNLKRILITIITFIIIMTTAVSALNCKTTDYLRCRTDPYSTIIKVFPPNTSLEVLNNNGIWWRVTDGYTTGWCHSNYLKVQNNNYSRNSQNGMKYIGNFKLTGYCSCNSCSDGYGNKTASGAIATVGRTVAASKDLPFGTKLYIEGVGYRTVEDRGGAVKGNKLDIFVANHSDCYSANINRTAKVYIVE